MKGYLRKRYICLNDASCHENFILGRLIGPILGKLTFKIGLVWLDPANLKVENEGTQGQSQRAII